MSRTLRIVLDLALGSVTKARPVISQAWDNTKNIIEKTRAKRLVCNPIMYKIEEKVYGLSEYLIMKLAKFRDKQLPKEAQYLQKELDKIKDRINRKASKTLKIAGSLSWPYLKIEAVPPLTLGFFNGLQGQNLEENVAKVMDSIINIIAGQIKSIDEAAERKIKEKEAAIKAQLEKQKADEKKKAAEIAAAAAKKSAEATKEAASTKSAEATKKK